MKTSTLVLAAFLMVSLLHQSSARPGKRQGGEPTLLNYCNANTTNGFPLKNCTDTSSHYYCDSDFLQCLVNPNEACSNSFQVNPIYYGCYNSTALSITYLQENNCHHHSDCPSGSGCHKLINEEGNNFGKLCSYAPGDPCDDKLACSSYYTCRDGTCQPPAVNDYCDPTITEGPVCVSGTFCNDFLLGCQADFGSPCSTFADCGDRLVIVCRDGTCQKPGADDPCSPEQTLTLPKTKCAHGYKCDSSSNTCQLKHED